MSHLALFFSSSNILLPFYFPGPRFSKASPFKLNSIGVGPTFPSHTHHKKTFNKKLSYLRYVIMAQITRQIQRNRQRSVLASPSSRRLVVFAVLFTLVVCKPTPKQIRQVVYRCLTYHVSAFIHSFIHSFMRTCLSSRLSFCVFMSLY